MTKPNAHVMTELQRLTAQYESGVDEGYRHPPNPLPAWFSKPYKDMTAWERGYIFGRELGIQERKEDEG